MMGVDEPDYGHLLADMEVRNHRGARGCYLFPRVEVEVGFILADDLPAPVAPGMTYSRPPPPTSPRSS